MTANPLPKLHAAGIPCILLVSKILLAQIAESSKLHLKMWFNWNGKTSVYLLVKVSRSQCKIVTSKLLSKNKWTNLLFYAMLRGLATAVCQKINIPYLYNYSGKSFVILLVCCCKNKFFRQILTCTDFWTFVFKKEEALLLWICPLHVQTLLTVHKMSSGSLTLL